MQKAVENPMKITKDEDDIRAILELLGEIR